MGNDPVSICNGALYRVGVSQRISSIESPTTVEERLCAEFYEDVRKELLRLHPWNFAKERVIISADGTSPQFEFDNRYRLPNDFIRVVQIGEYPDYIINTYYSVEGQFLLVKYSPDGISADTAGALNLVYIKDTTDVNKFDPLFKELMKLWLAEKLFPLHKKNTLQQSIQNEIAMKLPKAQSVDGQDKPPVRIEQSRVLRARRYGSGVDPKYQGFYFSRGC